MLMPSPKGYEPKYAVKEGYVSIKHRSQYVYKVTLKWDSSFLFFNSSPNSRRQMCATWPITARLKLITICIYIKYFHGDGYFRIPWYIVEKNPYLTWILLHHLENIIIYNRRERFSIEVKMTLPVLLFFPYKYFLKCTRRPILRIFEVLSHSYTFVRVFS